MSLPFGGHFGVRATMGNLLEPGARRVAPIRVQLSLVIR